MFYTLEHNVDYMNMRAWIISVLLQIHMSKSETDTFADPTCRNLLEEGNFTNRNHWQPNGCNMYNYDRQRLVYCLTQRWAQNKKQNIISFLGDSVTRQQYGIIRNMLLETDIRKGVYNADHITINSPSHTRVEYNGAINDNQMIDYLRKWSTYAKEDIPDILITATHNHFNAPNKNASADNVLQKYYENVLVFRDLVEQYQNTTDTLWVLSGKVYGPKVKDPSAWLPVALYNNRSLEAIKNSHIHVVKVSQPIKDHFIAVSPDGLHLGSKNLNELGQVLINYICNGIVDHGTDKCCRGSQPLCQINGIGCIGTITPVTLEMFITRNKFIFIFIFTCVLLTIVVLKFLVYRHGVKKELNESSSSLTRLQFITNLITTLCIMMYIFMCDRTQIFGAIDKAYNPLVFYRALLIFSILGLITIQKSPTDDVLNRDQTDEWKGWMQIIILVYHYTAASEDLQIYSHVRILVSSYLFMTGFGHTSYYLKSKHINIRRGLQVLFRLNFLVLCLCITMYKPYMFYYFVPLVTVSFLGVFTLCYITQLITPEDSNNHWKIYLVLVMILSVLTESLYRNKKVFDAIFSIPPFSFILTPNEKCLYEWWFRSSTDRFSCIYGMGTAIAFYVWRPVVDNDDGGGKKTTFWSHTTRVLVAMVALPAIMIYAINVGSLCRTKPQCNKLHPYTTIIPILAYISLRNIHPVLRKYNSRFFIWVGKISLELFLCQYHIWLTLDTKKLLSIVHHHVHPVVNYTITTSVFVLVAYQFQQLTDTWIKYLFHKTIVNK